MITKNNFFYCTIIKKKSITDSTMKCITAIQQNTAYLDAIKRQEIITVEHSEALGLSSRKHHIVSIFK